ncbi:MAG TPA: 1-(5-phosphoribosyl)-5-[(5-phosphoribosylamino)methylideneamino]imidazole-4-carboxamide isomerase [Victivallales bacterium]|nr:1-(5-phosphoribosyl)-5-[(5-phosphoribosylamino)methylideneamino]imidazole-4-carboxamide isomerase [Victivallales bacterium]
MKVIPAIDIISGKCVRLIQGDYNNKTIYSDCPIEVAKNWESKGAEYLHLVDLDGAKAGEPINIDLIKKICNSLEIPCECGGGIRSLMDAKLVLDAGVDRIILGTAAVQNFNLVRELLNIYGAERIVIGVDTKYGKVAVKGWLEASDVEVGKLVLQFAEIGVKRFIFTDISKDGVLMGPNFEATEKLCSTAPKANIIASGGVGNIEHIAKLKDLSEQYKNLEGVIVGKALYDNKINFEDIEKL